MKEALLTQPVTNGIQCLLCAHRCLLKEGSRGVCGVRQNCAGRVVALTYHHVAAMHNDPIEKKPLYHFLPGSSSFSVATMGCNFHCHFCQNHSLSMVSAGLPIYGESISPDELVRSALQYRSQSISYTYSEPTVYFELMLETAKLAHEAGLKNVMVTNGYMSVEALDMIAPYLDAANIDLKAFSETFYKQQCGARLAPVLDTIRAMYARGVHIELTTLLIPGLNDDPGEIKELISFILSVDKNIPWHVSRFYPQYRLTEVSPTPQKTIYYCLETAASMGVQYLYAGNVQADLWADTRCPSCKRVLIRRLGYSVQVKGLVNGVCSGCGAIIPGVWQ